ncbi:substrate binding domain-containing protein [Legionella tunisiensis]|uniref:substrate binding domain-containing protein n=1 Tax=Legionella tunisiensis TaxID=1034944 RepID=UPI00031390C6|nr:substrate binding domain-containing protein [Legionella tunisiensis]
MGRNQKEVSGTTKVATGTLRIATPVIAGNYYISEYIDLFLELHPTIKVNFHLGSKITNLIENKIDIYISNRNINIEDKFKNLNLMESSRKLYASPKYLEKYGTPKTLDELKQHNCLINSNQDKNFWVFENDIIRVEGNLSANNSDTLLKAALTGLGIIFTPESYVEEALNENKLKPILPQYKSNKIEVFVCYLSHKYIPMKIQAFINFLEKQWKKTHQKE